MRNLRNYRMESCVSLHLMPTAIADYAMEAKRNELLKAVTEEMPICAGCSSMGFLTINDKSSFDATIIRPVCNDPKRLCPADTRFAETRFIGVAGDIRGLDGSAINSRGFDNWSEYAEINPKTLNDYFERMKKLQNHAAKQDDTIAKPTQSPDVPSVNEDFW